MDLPTYTNIWRIEKRLYKLYDLRLPMPLPLVQIGVFIGVFVPWILLLKLVGIPFRSPWHVLYIVPPGVLTWMATRPVIEGKRLTELLLSQSRYLAEPRTWCRLTPIREPREVVVVARVWRRPELPAPVAAPERAAVKARRKARKKTRIVEEAPLVLTPAVASAPQPLAEYAAENQVPEPAPAPEPVPAAPPAAKPWRRPTRDISHEDDAPAELERPPAVPRLEAPPIRERAVEGRAQAGSGKRAFASGVRRPGGHPEFWKAVPPVPEAPRTPPEPQLPAADQQVTGEQAARARLAKPNPRADQPEPAEPQGPVNPELRGETQLPAADQQVTSEQAARAPLTEPEPTTTSPQPPPPAARPAAAEPQGPVSPELRGETQLPAVDQQVTGEQAARAPLTELEPASASPQPPSTAAAEPQGPVSPELRGETQLPAADQQVTGEQAARAPRAEPQPSTTSPQPSVPAAEPQGPVSPELRGETQLPAADQQVTGEQAARAPRAELQPSTTSPQPSVPAAEPQGRVSPELRGETQLPAADQRVTGEQAARAPLTEAEPATTSPQLPVPAAPPAAAEPQGPVSPELRGETQLPAADQQVTGEQAARAPRAEPQPSTASAETPMAAEPPTSDEQPDRPAEPLTPAASAQTPAPADEQADRTVEPQSSAAGTAKPAAAASEQAGRAEGPLQDPGAAQPTAPANGQAGRATKPQPSGAGVEANVAQSAALAGEQPGRPVEPQPSAEGAEAGRALPAASAGEQAGRTAEPRRSAAGMAQPVAEQPGRPGEPEPSAASAQTPVPAEPPAVRRPQGQEADEERSARQRSRRPADQRQVFPQVRPAAPTRPDIPQQPAAAAEEPAFNGEPGDVKVAGTRTPGTGRRKPPPDTRPDIPQVPPAQPDIPAVPGAFGAAARPAQPAPPPAPPVRKDPPKPWSKDLAKPQKGGDDSRVWPPVPTPRRDGEQQPPTPVRFSGPALPPPAPPPQQPQQPRPAQPKPAQPAAQEEAPPREVRSGPASPVRPRPLPPPPPAPPSGPAITPPDPEHEVNAGGLRRLMHAVGGGHGDEDAEYQIRIQQTFHGTRHIVVLGCTGGAGQTVTGLMLGHTFAQHNGEPVVAVDINPGPGALARRTRSETNETLTGLITRADQVNSLTAMRRYTSSAKSGLDVIAAGKNPLQALDDRDYALAIRTIDRFYSVTLLDAAAAVVARVLPYADQIVLVAPASADAPRAVAMTFEWLDGHGYEELRSRAVTVINGVSRRSMDDVEQAEAVARGRCRALVRIPWDDHLSMDRAPRNELKSLRAPTRRAYLALAGVVAGGFTVVPERYQEPQPEQEATR